MVDPSKLDPFTTIYRGRYNTRGFRRYHIDPFCPAIGEKPMKGRLGAMLAANRPLCSFEGGPPINFGGGDQGPSNFMKKVAREAQEKKAARAMEDAMQRLTTQPRPPPVLKPWCPEVGY